jgi:uncharacterized Tic20 family protein
MSSPQQGSAVPSGSVPLTQEQDRQWASFANLGGILGFLPALIIWLVFKDRGAFTNSQAKEALNFQLTIVILYIVGAILTVFFIGALITLAAWALSLIFSIIAFTKTKDGIEYRYPVTIRMIK